MLKSLKKAVESVDPEEVDKVISEGDASKSIALMRKMIFKE
jgi:hypothetical protein